MGDEPRGDLGLARGRTRPRLVATDAIGWGASMFSQKPVRTSRSARSHVLTRFILLTVAATVTALLERASRLRGLHLPGQLAGRHLCHPGVHRHPGRRRDALGPDDGHRHPLGGQRDRTGLPAVVFSLNGQYLLTDYSTPYTFTLDTRRFVDGSYTLAAHALLRDTNSTPDTTVASRSTTGSPRRRSTRRPSPRRRATRSARADLRRRRRGRRRGRRVVARRRSPT